mmetsp:Transcript_3927/g.8743  ORF Transcript_3927/g.8743 Transcript_3927/m.8743 type:complete len:222 (-) Transcript_3927:5257-5922(-)
MCHPRATFCCRTRHFPGDCGEGGGLSVNASARRKVGFLQLCVETGLKCIRARCRLGGLRQELLLGCVVKSRRNLDSVGDVDASCLQSARFERPQTACRLGQGNLDGAGVHTQSVRNSGLKRRRKSSFLVGVIHDCVDVSSAAKGYRHTPRNDIDFFRCSTWRHARQLRGIHQDTQLAHERDGDLGKTSELQACLAFQLATLIMIHRVCTLSDDARDQSTAW